MLSSKTKILAAGLSAAFLTMHSPARAQTVSIGAAANLTYTIVDLIGDFEADYATPYDFSVTLDSSGNLLSAIVNGIQTNGVSPYDIFLSADQTRPQTLANDGYTTSAVVPQPFFYAAGSVMLASQTVDISGGLPSTLNDAFVIADPTKAPYGAAAVSILNASPWSLGIGSGTTFPDGYVNIEPNIYQAYSATVGSPPQFDYGFIAKSFVCTQDSGGQHLSYRSGPTGYFHEYVYNGSYPYTPINQYGVEIDPSYRQWSGQTGQETQVENFINLVTAADSNPDGQTTFQAYCYSTTVLN